MLINPANASSAASTLRAVQEAAPAIGLQIQILNATTIGEIDAAFAALARERSGRPLRRSQRVLQQPCRPAWFATLLLRATGFQRLIRSVNLWQSRRPLDELRN